MSTREQLIARVIRLMAAGNSVEILGDHGSGRTHFLDRIRERLLFDDFRVVVVRAHHSLRSIPLLSLALAGIESARDVRPTSLPAVVDEIVAALPRGRAAILVDDWQSLDDVSWGALAAARAVSGVPILLVGSRGETAREDSVAPSAGHLSLPLPPLRFDEFERAVTAHAQARVDAATMSQLFAMSAGRIGLGLAIFDAAVAENKMETVRDTLVATADLWSDSLVGPVESILQPLEPALREAIELIALLAPVDVEIAREAIGADLLESAEVAGLLGLVPSSERLLVTVVPPLVSDYFRASRTRARRARLLARVEDLLTDDDGTLALPLDPASHDVPTAHFVRVVHESLHAKHLAARAAWKRTPSRSTAIDYVRASIRMPMSDACIDLVFEETRIAAEDSEEALAAWLEAYADHRAFYHGEASTAVADLLEAAGRLRVYGGRLAAAAVRIEHSLLGEADESALRDPHDVGLPATVRAATHRTLAFIRSSRGEPEQSSHHLQAAAELDPSDDIVAGVLTCLNDLLMGNGQAAAMRASRELDVGRAQLDPERIRAFSFVSAMCSMFAGRYLDAVDVVDRALAWGDPVSAPPFADRNLRTIASVLASRRGEHGAAKRLLVDAEKYDLADSPLPGGAVGWARAQMAAARGQSDEAVAILMTDGDRLWERGIRASAALAYLAAIEIHPTAERLAQVRERIESVPAPLIQDQLAFAAAQVAQDPDALVASARTLQMTARPGLALGALRDAARLFRERGDVGGEATADALIEEFDEELRLGRVDPRRFTSPSGVLTQREEQIARLAAGSLTNQQIAAELFVSIRTVESHLHRAMRKLGANRRVQLAEVFEAYD